MQQIERTVREYGQTRNVTDLQLYVAQIDVDELKLVIKKRISNADFSSFWNYLMQGLDTEDSSEKRYEIVTACINEIKERKLNTSHVNSLITRLCMELPKFLTKHLVNLCVLCMGFIQKGDVTETCWRELLPELLNVLVEKQYVEFNLNEMSGLEFKTQYINSLCMLDWFNDIITPLAIMFIEMPLSKEEHLKVIYKLVSNIEKLGSQELPAFVYQLLRFCKNQNSRLIFYKLQEYFDSKIYNNPVASDTSNSESIISDTTDEEALQAESTVLYHIYQSALLGHESIKDYLTSLKGLTKSPEFILHPFQLTVLLTISAVTFYEDKVFELIRQSISRNINEHFKKSECCWLRSLVPHSLNLEQIMAKIIQNSLNDRDLVMQGLVNLGFVLLGIGALLGRDSLIAKKQWNLGKYILLTLVKEKPHIAHTVLQRLCNHIVIGNNITQYVDCFREFSIKFTFITLENKSCIVELMETLISVPKDCAETILDIVIPLTKISPTIRDHLILLLRKALYSRSTETRQIAVLGFLKLLTKLKLSNLTALSQINSSSSSSGHSVLTQISLHRSGHGSQSQTFSSEALCLEVLNILKRCYMQQADVREKLYDGLHEAVLQNPELALPVLNLLWSQFLQYYIADGAILPPVDFSKLSVIRDADVMLQEPLGQLTSTISFLVVKIQELEDEDTNSAKFVDVFESTCKRLMKCELVHFELDDGTNLADVLPECKKKVITLKEGMSLYECLIGYKIWSWNNLSQRHAEEIIGLFQGYFRLQQCAKNALKSKKIDKKKKNANKTTQQNRTTQRSQLRSQQNGTTDGQAGTSQQDQNDSIVKGPKAVPIKLPHTVLDFKVLIKFLSLLHENVNWAAAQQANLLKVKHDIHQHVMQATISQLLQIRGRKNLERNKEYYNYCRDIAKIIYPKCVERLEEFLEFDVTTAALAVECFNIVLTIVTTNYSKELKSFLYSVGNDQNEEDTLTHLTPFILKYQKLFEMDDNGSDDQDFKKMLQTIANTLTLLVSQVPINASAFNVKFMDWMKNYAANHMVTTKNTANVFVNLWFSTYIKSKSTLSIFEEVISNLYQVLGAMTEETESSDSLKIINELTAQTFVQCLTAAIRTLLDNIEWMTNRLRSEYGVMIYSGGEVSEKKKESLANKERSVCCQLCLIISLMEALCNVKIPIEFSESVIKNISFLYNSLNSLTKYFILRSTKLNTAFQNARFERVVKLAGRRLAPVCNTFILYIEECQMDDVENTQGKKKNSSSLKNKVLKETKLIPKVVYEIEQFTKSIILLSNKTKQDLSAYIGAGTTRDFRIRDIKTVMEKNNPMNTTQSDADSTDLSTINEAEDENDDEGTPPRKIARI